MSFINEDFLLNNEYSKKLYHNYASSLPIIDYHCHLDPKEILEDKKYDNITDLWLKHDHYKWVLLRTYGVPEEYITGNKDPRDKFKMWAETIQNSYGNPLYHWTHLELKRYFGIDKVLSLETADEIYDETLRILNEEDFTPRKIIKDSNVEVICTTDDPMDDLEVHQKLQESDFDVLVLPAFRPDKAMNIEKEGFIDYLDIINKEFGVDIITYQMFLEVLQARFEYFHKRGCKLSDHALEKPVYEEFTLEEIDEIFKKRLKKQKLTQKEINKFKTATILFLAKQYALKGWTMQIHIGALRNVNSFMYDKLGPDTGFDCMNDQSYIKDLAKIMDVLNGSGRLPKTIVYSLNPNDSEVLATMIGRFQEGPTEGKIQLGSAWWFNDSIDGMKRQMSAVANVGLLSTFVGMLTDSRSFLSYTRHEYFRRLLCNIIGEWMEEGLIPEDYERAGEMVEKISYMNAKKYFGFREK